MKKVGIVTFHYPLNFGSVLQAQATQIAVERLGYESEIIDYRFVSSSEYDKIYLSRRNGGFEGMLIKPLLYIHPQKRAVRIARYNEYDKQLVKSKGTFCSYEELTKVCNDYDIFMSGSDQIWSSSVPEIVRSGTDAIYGYFLAFTEKPKIAYASCVAAMKAEDLQEYKEFIEKYSFIATREERGAEVLRELLGHDVPVVMDPSFLLTKEEWAEYTEQRRLINDPYVLLYSLRNGAAQRNWMKAIRKFCKDKKFRIVVISPYFSYPMPGVTYMLDAGPKEFLNLYHNAEIVFTDTFHGTAFAVNFNRPVFALGNKYWKKDIRKTFLMNQLGMQDRLIEDESEISDVTNYSYDYMNVNNRIDELRASSLDYLRNALENCSRD